MGKKIGYRPLRKTVAYMHRMVTSGKWKANSRIPTLSNLSASIGVSINTVRKAVAILETERLLNNNGSFGFCVIPPNLTKLYSINRQLYYLRLLKINLNALDIISKGGKVIGKFVVYKENDSIEIQNIVSGEIVLTTLSEIKDAVEDPIILASLIPLQGLALQKQKAKYFKQQKLKEIAKVVLKDIRLNQ